MKNQYFCLNAKTMELQNFKKKDAEVIRKFLEWRKEANFEQPQENLNFSWSNWGFGREDLAVSLNRKHLFCVLSSK